jgi:hypothetical protein
VNGETKSLIKVSVIAPDLRYHPEILPGKGRDRIEN